MKRNLHMDTQILNQLAETSEVQILINGVAYRLMPTPIVSHPQPAPELTRSNMFRMESNHWQISYNGMAINRKNSVGLAYIHALLTTPGIARLATDLITKCQGDNPDGKSTQQLMAEGYAEADISYEADINAEILPEDAYRRLKNQLDEMREDLKSLRQERCDDLALEKEQDIERVEEYLKKYHYRGHHTKFTGRAERDRKSVSVALNRAIKNIAKDHPALALHLENSIHTGKECNYTPENKVKWAL